MPNVVRATFCYYVAGYPIRYGLPLLRLLAPPRKGPSERGFFQPAEWSPCILQPIAIALLRRFGRLNVPVMPTITRPSISIPSVSHLLSPSLNHSSPRILRATFPEKPTFPIIKEKKKRKAILQSINSLTFPSGMHFFPHYRQLLQHQQLLRNHISQNLLRAGMRSQRRSGECTCLAS